ncbi:hypothetical protein CAPTEDRAFT_222040 [Capitella teleta]|uniref:Uncharacterized protein n=1 Tax=Capitella teleta TaxID=283909 RepID=R7UKU6_CAPTE|nr:hypothetical protein CAPTEDRAFT_222040 [Capitella teleta]|eukprot:ELU04408.1 hypothetical protein CAPTEDRAFT_222040 [Capitella teleta]
MSSGPREIGDEEELYANQLRKMQQSITGPPEPRSANGSIGYLGPDYNPPPPPNRSSSRSALDGDLNNPPVPQRNYDMVDVPRYTPAPGSAYRYPPTDQRGALV